MATRMFLKIDGVLGEATLIAHKDEIEVQSFSWGETQPGAPTSSITARGKVQMREAVFAFSYSKASPKLMQLCASGERVKEAKLSVQNANDSNPEDYLIWTFGDVLISGYQTGVNTGTTPLDQVSISFQTVAVEYKTKQSDGKLATAARGSWNLKENRPAT